jgi:hypothetical protein
MISRTLKYTLLTVILLAAMLVVSAVPVAAANSNAGNNQAKPLNGAAVDNLIEKLEPYVTRCNDGTFRLDIPSDAKINKSSQEFKAILAGMNSVNELIRQGELVTTSDLTVYSVDGSQFVLQDGIDRFKARWYGFEIWLSHSTCMELEGAGAEVIMSNILVDILPISWPLAVAIAAFMGVGAVILVAYDNGCGVHLKFLGGVVLFGASSQTC